jgi:hypothetical protein
MKIYHFLALSLNRLVRESVSGFYSRRIKYPDPDRPFTALDPATMPWPASANTFWDAKVTPFIWMWTPIDCLHEEDLTLK